MPTIVDKYDVIVIGGGASGMMAAGQAAQSGCRVVLLEKMPRLGRKLAITGKGRCNLTNVERLDAFLLHYGKNGRFLRNCFARFFSQDLIDFLKEHGVATAVERGGRVFPADKGAEGVVECLIAYLQKHGVEVRTAFTVEEILTRAGCVAGVQGNGADILGNAVIVATGGRSYPLTGSTGDGYRFAMDLGHRVRKPEPNLVPLETDEEFVTRLRGLSLRNVELSAFAAGRRLGREFGEMLFTHFGISGPIVLTMSREIVRMLPKNRVTVSINFKPALSRKQLELRLLREFEAHGRMNFKNIMKHLLPLKLVDVFVNISGVPGCKKACEVDRAERRRALYLLQDFPLTIKRARPIEEAIVTAGGVALDELDPRTMQSKIIKGLFFCGEVIDITGDTGGYNLQSAFSTGYVAGGSACGVRRGNETVKINR